MPKSEIKSRDGSVFYQFTVAEKGQEPRFSPTKTIAAKYNV